MKETTKVDMYKEAVQRIADVDILQNGMEDAGESETTVTTAVSTGTDRTTLSLAVIPQFSQHTQFSNYSNQTKHTLQRQ